MTIKSQIDALPEWPTWEKEHAGVPSGNQKLFADIAYYMARGDAALARLALAKEVISKCHCTGHLTLDDLLKALEVPRG